MDPPVDLVEGPRRTGIDARKGLGQGPARERPDLPGGLGHVNPQRLAEEAGDDDPQDQQQDDGVVGGVVGLALVAETVGFLEVPATDRPQDADQDGQAEEVHEGGEEQIESPAQKEPSQQRSGKVSLLGDEGRPDEEDHKAEEDQPVHDPRIGVAEGLHLQQPVGQQQHEPLLDVVNAQFGLAQGDPELPAPVEAIGEDRHGKGRQGIEEDTEGFGIPVDLPPFVADRKHSLIHSPSLQWQ
jgi:hypothetical protein